MASQLLIQFGKKLSKDFKIQAHLDISLKPGAITAVIGSSGCGKTSVLRCLAGLDTPDQGSIQFGQEIWFDSKNKIKRSPQFRKTAFISQESSLFPHLSVHDNIRYGISDLPVMEAERHIKKGMDLACLSGLENRFPATLSGGEKQRVSLARAFSARPRLFLLDEPFSALDSSIRVFIRASLKEMIQHLKVHAVMVTHDLLDVWSLAEQLIVMHRGRVVQVGEVNFVFRCPQSEAAARALGAENLLEAQGVEKFGNRILLLIGVQQLVGFLGENVPMQSRYKVYIRPDHVTLNCFKPDKLQNRSKVTLSESNNLNQFRGEVIDILPEGYSVRIQLNCGFPLIVRLPAQKFSWDLGSFVWVTIQAKDIHLISQDSL